jgi:hypothetical protein
MNKLKNIGITALAGTLVSLSAAQAGGVSVTGSWELSYTNLNHTKDTGNKLGVNKNIGFAGSGDLTDGGGVTWATTIGLSDASGISSASMSLNMGGIATLAYDSGTGGYGANAVDNIVPTAWEEIDYGLSTGITDLGAVSSSNGSIHLSVKAPVAGTGFSLSYAPRVGEGQISDGATGTGGSNYKGVDMVVDFVDYDAAHFGFRWGFAGQIEIVPNNCRKMARNTPETGRHSCDADSLTGQHKDHPYGGSTFTKLQLGPLHLGAQATFKDPQESGSAGIKNKRSIIAGAALVFGDTISLSYGEAWDRYRYNDACRGGDGFLGQSEQAEMGLSGCGGLGFDGKGGEYETIKYTGWSAALNIGPVAIKGTKNTVGGWGENSSNSGEGLDKSHSEVNLSIAF